MRRLGLLGIFLIAAANAAHAGTSAGGPDSHCASPAAAATQAPTPPGPYPLAAAGWGPEAGSGLMASRWAEDWTCLRAAGKAPAFKAMPLGRAASLTLGAESRLRFDHYGNALLVEGNDYQQGLFRGILGADLRINPNVRVFGEVGTGQVDGRRDVAPPNLQNAASLQQLFVDVRGEVGSTLVGAMAGRHEFADGPRQLLSLSDGANLHRTWNGLRVYAHGEAYRLGAFSLRVTRQGRDSFDEEINHGERLQGLNASFVVSPGETRDVFLDPFWIHSENPAFRAGGQVGLDDRNTLGLRLWGRRGRLKFDWLLAHQDGRYRDRDTQAWALFAVHGFALSDAGWKPRLTGRIDVASGGGAYDTGTMHGFNPLYASSSYLGEGQFLGLTNLVLVSPGFAVSPTARTSLSIEYGFARRYDDDDAAYAGGLRPYPGTQVVPGHQIGGLLRLGGSWVANRHLSLSFSYEHLAAGDVLERAGIPSGYYAQVGATFRY